MPQIHWVANPIQIKIWMFVWVILSYVALQYFLVMTEALKQNNPQVFSEYKKLIINYGSEKARPNQ